MYDIIYIILFVQALIILIFHIKIHNIENLITYLIVFFLRFTIITIDRKWPTQAVLIFY